MTERFKRAERGSPGELSALGPCGSKEEHTGGSIHESSTIHKVTVMLICKLLFSAGQDLGRKA